VDKYASTQIYPFILGFQGVEALFSELKYDPFALLVTKSYPIPSILASLHRTVLSIGLILAPHAPVLRAMQQTKQTRSSDLGSRKGQLVNSLDILLT